MIVANVSPVSRISSGSSTAISSWLAASSCKFDSDRRCRLRVTMRWRSADLGSLTGWPRA
jgi:hypothetical protein